MEIINANYCRLSNYEVLQVLTNIKDLKNKRGLRNLATITYETMRCLEETPCRTQSKSDIEKFLDLAKPFKLTSKELLMLVNDPPTSALHIQLIIEDSEERLSETQVQQILEYVSLYLLPRTEE